ncbi:serine O-acetyltransferase [Vibrio sp. 10N.222.54.B12]|uniref:serine O-acetyltransferase n=1 Tax=Vibrio sp. 10N.222.54.B12 TaxID=3229636 RepID=UPI00354ED764
MSHLPYYFYIIYHFMYKMKIPFIPTLLVIINRLIFGLHLPASAEVGSGTRFSYGGCAVVVHARAVIGKNCIIGPAVTIGGRSKKNNVPVIGDNVYIGGGAKILGDITVGSGSIIGANSVVISDVPEKSMYLGIPAKLKKENIKINDYI